MLVWLERHRWAIVAVTCLVFASGLGVQRLAAGESAPRIEFQAGSNLPLGTPIRVHVVGAVAQAGVYELREGDRLVDALAVAGGPTDRADLDALNLARRVRDEEQVVVPAKAGPSATAVATLAPGARIDINTAPEAVLDQLPGIGEAYSRRIVDSRRLDGPFKTTDELVGRRVVPQATYDRIRELITVGP